MDAEQQPSLPQTKLTLHWQRLTIVVASIVGISSLFLPWLYFPIGETFRETTSDGAITAAFFLLPFVVALIGARSLPLSIAARWLAVIPGVLIFTHSFFYRTGQELAQSAAPGIGPFVCFFAGAGIVIVSFLVRRQKQPPPLTTSQTLPPPVQKEQSKITDKITVTIQIVAITVAIALGGYLYYSNWDKITGVTHGFLQEIRRMKGEKEIFNTAGFDAAIQDYKSATTELERLNAASRVNIELARSKDQFKWADVGAGLFRIAREKFHAYLLIALLGVIFAFVYAKALSIRSRNCGREKAK